MAEERVVFVCEHCFKADSREEMCCGHPMIRCDAGVPGSERSRPLYDEEGELRSHAPRWWLERHDVLPGSDSTRL